MSHRKILFLNKDNNEVAFILDFNDEDHVNAGLVAGLLSNPTFIEVDVNSQAGLGWEWDGEKTISPEWIDTQ